MNSTQNRAEAQIVEPDRKGVALARRLKSTFTHIDAFSHWKWRMEMVSKIAGYLEPKQFGVQAFYVFGSVKNASAGPNSDIDILIHFRGSEQQKADLMLWLNAWDLGITEMNYLCTGIKSTSLLDIHIVTDDDINNRDSFAMKIDAITDPAQPLEMGHLAGK